MPDYVEEGAIVRFLAEVQAAAEKHFGPRAQVLGVWNEAERISGMMVLTVRVMPDMVAVARGAGSEEAPP